MAEYRTMKVRPANRDEAWQDIVRVHKDERSSISRHELAVMSVAETGKKKSVVVLGHETKGEILIDMDLRNDLGLSLDRSYSFSFRKAGLCERVRWYTSARSPAVWIPAQLAVWSVALGILGAVLGVVGAVLGAIGLAISLKG